MTYLRRLSVVVGIVTVLVLATTRSAAAVSGFTGPYELQNWSAIGPGTTSKTPLSGPATSATFSYSLTGSAVFFDQTWRFSTTAAASGPVTFNWAYSGYHAFFDVRVHLQAFADGPAGTTFTSLVSDGPVNCCAPPSGGFSYSGSASLTVTQGYAFGILAGGSNFDADSRLQGQVTLSNLVAPSSTSALTFGTPTINGLPAGSAPGPSVPVGGAVTLAVPVTNSGEVTVTNVTVTSPIPGLSPFSCPAATLAPSESMTCTATTVVVVPGAEQVPITVTAQGPSGQAVLAETTAYYTGVQAPPTINGIDPSFGAVAGGTSVTISGTGFQQGATVSFGGSAAGITSVTATQMQVTTPPHAAGAVDVTVTNPDQQSATLANGFTYVAGPTITGLTPTSGPTAGGTAVTIQGTGFQQGATVSFGGTAVSVGSISPNAIAVTTSAHAAGSVDVIVTNPDGQAATLTNGFTYIAAPTLAGLSPQSGPVSGGTIVTLTGTSFQDGAMVSFGGTPATNVTFLSVTQLRATTPAHAAGMVSVTVTNPDQQSATLANAFTYVAAPTLTSLTPTSGPTTGGTRVTIRGSGFQPGATVSFDGIPATMVTVMSATEIQATTPPHAPGPVAVSVLVPVAGTATLPGAFTYRPPPSITGLTPDRGPVAGGTAVTISGEGFVPGQTTVTFDLTPAHSVSCPSTTQCQAVSPPGMGSVSVRVTVDGETSPGTAATFTYEPPPPQPMTLTAQVWRQIPPLVSENQTEGTVVPVVGGVVEALVGGTVCGQGVTDGQGRLQLTVAADPPARGCGRPGVTVTFRVNGALVGEAVAFRSGGQAGVTLILPGPAPPPRR